MRMWRRFGLCVLAWVCGWISTAHANGPELTRFTLTNGMRVWYVHRTESPSVAVGVALRVGVRDEEESNNGISHFLEHMCFSGSERHSEAELVDMISAHGGVWNAQTGDERTMFWVLLPAEQFEVAADWASQVVFHPTLPEEKVGTVRSAITQEKGGKEPWIEKALDHMGYDNDLDKKMRRALFPDSSLGLQAIGTDKGLAGITRQALVDYHTAYYTPTNAVLIISGNVERARVDAICAKYFADLVQGKAPVSFAEPVLPEKPPSVYKARTAGTRGQATLQWGVRTVGVRHSDRWALDVLGVMLGQSFFKELQLKNGLSYVRYVMQDLYSDAGVFLMHVETRNSTVRRVESIVNEELDRVRRGDIDSKSLTDARNAVKGRWALSLEGNYQWLHYLESQAFVYPNDEPLDDIPTRVDAVTADDLKRVVQTYFVPERTFKGVLRPAFGCL